MRVVHETRGGERAVLATAVERADSPVAQIRGLRFRREVPDDYALVFEFDRPRWGLTDMLFVRFPIDVVWLRGEEVVRVETLSSWWGLALAKSDGFVEFPAGTATDVEPGDRLVVMDDDGEMGDDHDGEDEQGLDADDVDPGGAAGAEQDQAGGRTGENPTG